MKKFVILLIAGISIAGISEAQSPEMPEPLAIVVDADGKPMVQVVGFRYETIYIRVEVLFEFEGYPVLTVLNTEAGCLDSGIRVFFLTDDCTGPAFLDATVSLSGNLHQVQYTIAGPDPSQGTYEVYKASTHPVAAIVPGSALYHQTTGDPTWGCREITNGTVEITYFAEKVVPNPLEGFHGPTVANPERILTVKGGTRLP